MKIQLLHKFEDIISIEDLLAAWQEFARGKRKKSDVQEFQRNLYDNILQLHNDLSNKVYKHGAYHNFNISDPKPRKISKASVRDRLVHHAVYRILYPFFDMLFIYDSYSCRENKGTHKAVRRLNQMFFEASDDNHKTCWVLKLDIKNFFASIDHGILISILKEYIPDKDIMWLLEEIIMSFPRKRESSTEILKPAFAKASAGRQVQDGERGLPLGNLTSQLFVNIYMNEFDQFIKHKLKIKYYIRYADDLVILNRNKQQLMNQLTTISDFLQSHLKLNLHPNKIILKTYASGIDFLGWINFPNHRILRTSTKRRMIRRVNDKNLQSYLGLIKHGNTFKIKQEMLDYNWLNKEKTL